MIDDWLVRDGGLRQRVWRFGHRHRRVWLHRWRHRNSSSLCIDGCVTQNLGGNRSACSSFGMKGQSFILSELCQLKQVTIAACCSSPIQFNIRKAPPGLECDASNWNTGDIVYSSSPIANICQSMRNCGTTSGYKNRYWRPNHS